MVISVGLGTPKWYHPIFKFHPECNMFCFVTIKYCLTPLIVVNKIEAWSCIGEETVLPKKLLEQNVHVGGESMSREWGEMTTDFQGDPRKVFINYLIFLIKEIENRIYLYSKVSTAIVPLMGLIDSLDEKSKKTLKEQYDQLEGMKEGKVGLRTNTGSTWASGSRSVSSACFTHNLTYPGSEQVGCHETVADISAPYRIYAVTNNFNVSDTQFLVSPS